MNQVAEELDRAKRRKWSDRAQVIGSRCDLLDAHYEETEGGIGDLIERLQRVRP